MITPGALAMRDAMDEILSGVKKEMIRRGKVATGRTISTLSTSVTVSDAAVVGDLTGEEQWKYVGNGRGPGGMPPINNIQRWINAKGLTISAYAVARTIAKKGSKDYRNRAPNVFLSAFEEYSLGNGPGRLESSAANEYEQQALEMVLNTLKNGRPS